MANFGIKVGEKNLDVTNITKPSDFNVFSKYPEWKIDIRASQIKRYGLVRHTFITAPLLGQIVDIYTFAHNYGYKPSFLVQYNIIGFTFDIYGIGNPSLSPTQGNYQCYVDEQFFYIKFVGSTFAAGPTVDASIIGKGVDFRFYLFAEDIENDYIA